MPRPSTRAIGLAFENHTQRFLNGDLRMALAHVGGRGDGGVDLRGFWWVPRRPRRRVSKAEGSGAAGKSEGEGSGAAGKSEGEGSGAAGKSEGEGSGAAGKSDGEKEGGRVWKPPPPPGLKRDGTPGARIRPFRVVVQCKAERRALGPRIVREFEGTLGHLAAQDARVPMIGVLSSQSGFSLASMEHAVRTRVPLLLLHLEGGRPDEEAGLDDRPEPEPEPEPEPQPVDGGPTIPVTGAWWNASLGTLLADAGIQLRREIVGGGTRVGVLTAGERMGRYGPPAP
ncbi:hypothetical protein CcaverHIS002_0503560 [Cutaneotrichosporon cavernicola]|uniref:Restriction endonuclease type IV Mrr domain-containing protein n=1 Tax=Cutaneotrichosporon cavernicola TaxID=279322 RepID=A0AA48L6F1_9TREE|nr:uncharacterized protein CcaverHIS019_0504130 [Cutaneotrichosporon cavernicola]BEI84955.1 hypothetical protein CcaverHIS002_0503560 [Cutaneotrichosporon cavernicola]BEI92785.1 hypothetical protein CcaverHIS019_0504130 [Cutaneotrichosporon cavernicola]BEJ00561.1 hypothetical protein CcaverHIS631_0504180 [Cutaneotrichosporon cavernicola]BEJ08329.1 hypothetical protein CcaverHIS641_0504140 [Cutaneotrichosporon cavernicola]